MVLKLITENFVGGASVTKSRFVSKDETGVYKNLLQEIAQRVGSPLPMYTTFRSGLGHQPVFTGRVELAGIIFTGEPAKNKKQAEKNAAIQSWSTELLWVLWREAPALIQTAHDVSQFDRLWLKREFVLLHSLSHHLWVVAQRAASSSRETESNDEQEQVTIARALLKYRLEEKMAMETANTPHPLPFPKKFPTQHQRPSASQSPSPFVGSKILPFIRPKSVPRSRPASPSTTNDRNQASPRFTENHRPRPQNFPVAGAAPFVPFRHYQPQYHGMAPPVTIRTAVPVYSAPPLPPPPCRSSHIMAPPVQIAPPVRIRPVVPAFAAPPPVVRTDEPAARPGSPLPTSPSVQKEETGSMTATKDTTAAVRDAHESSAVESMKQLKI
ncbi:hypothetical protein ACLOJK_009303 [Asimina triloba]